MSLSKRWKTGRKFTKSLEAEMDIKFDATLVELEAAFAAFGEAIRNMPWWKRLLMRLPGWAWRSFFYIQDLIHLVTND